MKRMAPVYALLLLYPLSLVASDQLTGESSATVTELALCSMDSKDLVPAGKPAHADPPHYTYLNPICYATTDCANGSTITCPNVSYTEMCVSRHHCWNICEGQFQYCPDAAPTCYE